MSKIKTRLMSLLVALSCVFTCLSVGALVISNNAIGASAATTYTIGPTLTATGASSATAIYAYPTDETKKPDFTDGAWAYNFSFVAGTGDGMTFNGELISGELKKPGGDFYIGLAGNVAESGDIVILDGTFRNADVDVEFVFINCGLKYNGSAWESYTPLVTREIGALELHVNSSVGGAKENNAQLYLMRTDGNQLPVKSWDYAFAAESAGNFTKNGTAATLYECKSTGDGFWFRFDALNAGDEVVIGGTYYSETLNVKYVVTPSAFVWTGTGWENSIVYDEYTVSNLQPSTATSANSSSDWAGRNDCVFLKIGGTSVTELTYQNWDVAFTFKEGDGLKVNGNDADINEIKFTGDGVYIVFSAISAGDVLTLSGTFVNDDVAKKYVVNDCSFTWNGSTWETYVEYTTHQIGALILHGNSNVGDASGMNNVLYLMKADASELPVLDWSKFFVAENAENFKVNGETATLSECKSTGDGFFFAFNALDAGDVLTISGTFVCEELAVKYVIEESQFQWTGERWNVYVPPIEYNQVQLGKVTGVVDGNYLTFADGITLPVSSWDYTFNDITGNGITIDGVSVSLINNIKSVGNKLHVAWETAPEEAMPIEEGSILLIEGSFRNEDTHNEYVIEESKFIWNGTAWAQYIVVDLGRVFLTSTTTNSGYIRFKSDVAFASAASKTFTYSEGTGVLQGETKIDASLKQVAKTYLQLNLSSSATEGQIVTIGGSFVYEEGLIKYVIADTKFKWDGSAWSVYEEVVEPTIYEIGALVASAHSTSGGEATKSTCLYMDRADGQALPIQLWENPFILESGDGLKVNDISVDLLEMQSSDAGLYIVLENIQPGDVVSLSGTFFCENQNVKYVIEESKFVWNGTVWEKYVDYEIYEIGRLTVGASTTNEAIYFDRADGESLPITDGTWSAKLTFIVGSGAGVNYKGKQVVNDIKIPNNLYVGLGEPASIGDKVVIGGTFSNVDLAVKYVITESTFQWNSNNWVTLVEESDLEDYDVVTIADLGLGTEFNADASSAGIDKTALKYVKSANNTTGSVKFRFGYKPTGAFDAETHIRLRSVNSWWGIRFILSSNTITSWYKNVTTYTLPSSAQGYVIELGAIDLKDGENIFVYAKVDGALVISDTIAKTAEASLEEEYTDEQSNKKRYTFGAFNTNGVSVYFNQGVNALITDPDHVLVTYTTSAGTFTEYANITEDYVLAGAKSYNTFIGWWINGVLYDAEATIPASDLSGSITATAVEIEFTLEDGASIRIPNETGERAGIRFTANIDRVSFNNLISNYGITVEEYGILIMPYDWLGEGQQPNLDDADLTVEGVMLKLVADRNNEPADGDISYKGAMVNVNSINYERLFAGRGYMQITFANGETKYVYTYFNADNNVRSIRQIAQKYIVNTEDQNPYSGLNQSQKDVVDAYAAEVDAEGNINLMNYDAYKANNYFELTAWYYPELDDSNGYMNTGNFAIAEKMKDAGIKVVYLDGEYHLGLDTAENIERTRQIIKFFWSQGLKTIAFGSNASTNLYIDYSAKDFPDFSDCEGFMGFLVWDEPQSGSFATLAEFAQKFEATYAGTGATFMANLLPSYASIFNGTSSWFDSTLDTLKKGDYKAYVENYCKTVLSQISGEKWLSMDSYPINKDQTLTANFLFDLAILKYYAETYGATSHAVLQSSGWVEDGNETKNRMPTEAEMRMQAYTAMAFGIDSISWWSYSDMRGDNQQNPTDSNDYYTGFATVNNELASFGHVYRAFSNWKGIILGAGKDNGIWPNSDDDYEAVNAVKGQIGAYELSASDTKHLASVSTNKTNWNYLMGVMEDTNGNEGYVLCNYNDHTADRAQTITITFDSNVTEVIIYRGGVKTPVAVASKTLTVNLATGEGVMIIPSKIG